MYRTLEGYPEVELGEIIVPARASSAPPQGPQPPPPPPGPTPPTPPQVPEGWRRRVA